MSVQGCGDDVLALPTLVIAERSTWPTQQTAWPTQQTA